MWSSWNVYCNFFVAKKKREYSQFAIIMFQIMILVKLQASCNILGIQFPLYCSPNIVRVIKSRRMKWAGNVARMRERRGVYRVSVGKPE